MAGIVWSEDAGNDFLDIIAYTKERFGKDQAAETSARIVARIEGLPSMPHQGKIVVELRDIGVMEIREVLEYPWRIFYKMESETIFVVSIIDGRRNIEEILVRKAIDGRL